jgi:hypothetical protein
VGAALKSSTPAAGPAPAARREAEIRGRSEAALPESLARDKSALRKDGLADRAAAPAKPVSLAERRVLRRKAVLAPALHGLAARVRKEGKNGTLVRAGGPELRGGSLIVQVWLGSGAPKDAAKKLAALGFLRSADLYPGRLLLGTLPVAQLERMADVAWVIRIEPPRFLPTGPAVRATRANPAGATRQGDRRL